MGSGEAAMKLAFCTKVMDGSELDDRFGRAAAFRIVDSKDGSAAQTLENSLADAAGSAGIGAVQLLCDNGVEGIIAPHLGPKAADAARRLGLKVWHQGSSRTVEAALEEWKAGRLEEAKEPEKPKGLYRA